MAKCAEEEVMDLRTQSFSIALLLGIAACGIVPKGTPVCVAGFGQCDFQDTNTSVQSLTLTVSSSTVSINNTVTFKATGGTAPYTYSINSGGIGSINSSTGVYTAPTTTLTTSPTTITVTVTDSESPAATKSLSLTVQN